MSWDISVQRFRKEYHCLADIPNDEECVPLGSSAEVRAAIDRYFPAIDWSDPGWGRLDADFGSVEFNMGNAEPNCGFMMHIRASGEVVPMIVAMSLSERWQALDPNAGTFLEKSAQPVAGLEDWAAYRAQVVGRRKGLSD